MQFHSPPSSKVVRLLPMSTLASLRQLPRNVFLFVVTVGLAGASLSHAAVENSGRATLLGQSFLSDPSNPPPNLQKSQLPFSRIEVEPSFQAASDNLRFRLKGIAGYDYSYQETDERNILIPQEAFLETRAGKWNFLAGINTYNWGTTDIANPLDVINPRSYRNPFNPYRIGSPSLSIAWSGDSTSLELVYIPRQFPHELPPASSRYLPREVSTADFAAEANQKSAQIILPDDPLRFSWADIKEFDKPFDNNYALRLRQNFGQLETHWVAYEGMPNFPDIFPSATFFTLQIGPPEIVRLEPDLPLVPRYQRVRVAGVGLVYSWETTILRMAHAQTWRTSTDLDIALPITTVVALEKSFSLSKLEWTWFIQGISQTDGSGQQPMIYSTQEVFNGSLITGFRVASGLDFSMLLGIIVNPTKNGQIYSVDTTTRLSDHWQFKAGGQYIVGGNSPILKAMEPTSNVEAGFNYFW